MNEMILIGKTTAPFGIKGEIKVISDFERANDAFVVGKKVLINNIEHTITSIRFHKNKYLMGIDNLNNINNILDFIGFNVYIARRDLNLKEDDYLYTDLIRAQVMENNEVLGEVIEILKGNSTDYLKVKGKKEFLIPIIPEYIISFDNNKKIIYTKMAKNLII